MVAALLAAGTDTDAARAEEPRWGIELHAGAAHSFDSPLVIEQDGAELVDQEAKWSGRSFESPLYYVLRAWRRTGERAWMLDLVHLKVYLENPPPTVQAFSISHGYNLLQLSRVSWRGPLRYGGGLGVVLAHPENTVSGRRLDEDHGGYFGGYYFTGPAVGLILGATTDATKRAWLAADLRTTMAWAKVPVVDGDAVVPNYSIHASLGAGLGF